MRRRDFHSRARQHCPQNKFQPARIAVQFALAVLGAWHDDGLHLRSNPRMSWIVSRSCASEIAFLRSERSHPVCWRCRTARAMSLSAAVWVIFSLDALRYLTAGCLTSTSPICGVHGTGRFLFLRSRFVARWSIVPSRWSCTTLLYGFHLIGLSFIGSPFDAPDYSSPPQLN